MSMTGEMTLSTYEDAAFAELVEGFDRPFVQASTLATSGLTSVMERARSTAEDLISQRAAGITDVNAKMTAFQSSVM